MIICVAINSFNNGLSEFMFLMFLSCTCPSSSLDILVPYSIEHVLVMFQYAVHQVDFSSCLLYFRLEICHTVLLALAYHVGLEVAYAVPETFEQNALAFFVWQTAHTVPVEQCPSFRSVVFAQPFVPVCIDIFLHPSLQCRCRTFY